MSRFIPLRRRSVGIHLTTLGGLRILRDGAELERLPAQRLRAALLVYMAVEQCASRETLVTVFWPESSESRARHALRQSLYHVRHELGSEWLQLRTHDLCVSGDVRADVHDFSAALDAGEFEAAARLYAGPFLGGVHLADLQPWQSWVDAQRVHYARGFRRACREWVDARRSTHDVQGAIDAAQHWLAPDPLDDEAQHALIEALADAGERTAALRQYETYARLLDAESLTPLDATVALVERVRSVTTMPTIDAASDDASTAKPALTPDAPQPARPKHDHSRRGALIALRRRRYRIAAAALLVLLVVAAWGVNRVRAPLPLSAADVAVLPFAVHGGADAQYLSDGLVSLLASALDGSSLRALDARTGGNAAVDAGVTLDVRSARRVASRLGAGLYVLGEAVQAGDRLHIEASVYRSTGLGRPLARASASGEANAVFELVESVAAQILAGTGAADRLTRAAAQTTSLEAFKAFMGGDAALRGGHFERAVDAYTRAVGIDTAFAVAYYRLALARDWAAMGAYDEAALTAARHADRLSPRDRALLEALGAYHTGDAEDAERRYRAILSRYPDDFDASAQLGEVLFHFGPLRGRSLEDAAAAWRTVLAYELRNLWAAVHLARIAAVRCDVATLDTLLAHFSPAERMADRRLVQLGLLRALAARDSAEALRLAAGVRGWEDAAVYQLAAYLAAYSDNPAGARRVARTLLEPHRGAGLRADVHGWMSLLYAAEGDLRSARAELDTAIAVVAGVPSRWHRTAFALVSEWWLTTLPLPHADTTIARVRAGAMAAALPLELDGSASIEVGDEIWFGLVRMLGEGVRMEALRQYVVGLLSLRLHDRAQADASAQTLAGLVSSPQSDWFARDSERALRAFIARADGRAEDALRILDTLELGPADVGVMNIVPFVARAHERHLRGELLRSLGRNDEAEAWFASLAALSVPETAYRGLRD
jgi:DNA-binding SARP family transcriptional activator/tetratricopeptide (TPR) repeat protein